MKATRCSIEGCEKPVEKRGWCSMHLSRWKRHGTTQLLTPRPPDNGKPCSVPGCTKVVKARNYCPMHYGRWQRGQDLVAPRRPAAGRPLVNLIDRHPDGCWLWTGQKDRDGYGRMTRKGKTVAAHRWAYAETRGAVPEGLELDHLCFVRHCVNPDHLEPVTHAENIRRAWARKRVS